MAESEEVFLGEGDQFFVFGVAGEKGLVGSDRFVFTIELAEAFGLSEESASRESALLLELFAELAVGFEGGFRVSIDFFGVERFAKGLFEGGGCLDLNGDQAKEGEEEFFHDERGEHFAGRGVVTKW